MDYRAPGFRQPQQFDVPNSLDGIFNAYTQMKAQDKAASLQDLQMREEFSGTNPLMLSSEQRARGFAGPTMAPPVVQGAPLLARNPADAQPQMQFSQDPDERRIQEWVHRKRQGSDLAMRGKEADIRYKDSETVKNLREPALDPAKRAELANKLRDDLNNASKPFVTMRNYYAKINTASQDPTGASDWALVYGFNKMLDEASAVRDPEVQNTMNTGSFAESARAAIERLQSGKKLDDNVRRNLVAESKKLFGAMEPYNTRTVGQYRDIARRQGLDERDVVIDSSFIPPPEPDMVRVISPDGTSGRIPRSNLGKALQGGYREAP